MKIAIAGGHGQIALRLTALLATRGDEVVGLIRNPDHAAGVRSAGALAVVCDLERVDIDALVEQTEIGTIIAHSTSGVASEILDVIRAQAVGLDDFFARWVARVLRRDPAGVPLGPPTLVAPPAGPPALPAGSP